jgi:hypothetical protein
MDHAEAREILELAAVEPGGLARLMAGDTPEAAALAGHLAGCVECTREMARLRRVAGIVRGVVRTTPPPELRERTLAFVRAVGRDRSGAGLAPGVAAAVMPALGPAAAGMPVASSPADRGRRWGRLAALAAVIALAVVGTGVAIVQSRAVGDRDATIAQQAEGLNDLATVTAWTLRVSGQPDARRVELAAAAAPKGHGTLLFSPATRELVVVAMGLARPPAGYELRCWVESDGTRRSVGRMFFGGGMSYWVGPVDAVSGLSGHARFGVSLVDLSAPGVQGDPVLVGEL